MTKVERHAKTSVSPPHGTFSERTREKLGQNTGKAKRIGLAYNVSQIGVCRKADAGFDVGADQTPEMTDKKCE
jgi:hypothetical protein